MVTQGNSDAGFDGGEAGPARPVVWRTGRFSLTLNRVHVMGIVNLTPDSFSDAGRWADAPAAIHHCEELVRQGADLLDLGAESTRPGAPPVSADLEWARLEPVLRGALKLGVPVSVDTFKPEVMSAALRAGADLINDVRALTQPGALRVLAEHGSAGVCLMHSRGDAATMQSLVQYDDVVAEVARFLVERAQEAVAAGIGADRLALDPGYGFAKTAQQTLELLARQIELQQRLRAAGVAAPLLVGLSRKSAIGHVTGRPVGERASTSAVAALLAAQKGARIVRVHDVAQTVDALRLWQAIDSADDDRERVAIALGANLGDARQAMAQALRRLDADPSVCLRSVSSLYRSTPVQAQGPDFLNAVALLTTTRSPTALLALLQQIERDAGRQRPYPNAPRTLDLDLLLFGEQALQTAELVLPHPRLHLRRFVLEPLAELDPQRHCPGLGPVGPLVQSVAAQGLQRIEGPNWWREAG